MRRIAVLIVLTASLAAGELDLSALLPVDPANVYGKLDNGMRYVIRSNKTPPGKVNMMLHIHSGSLDETDAQRGVAHFLEHMAFNGSKHFPPGEMVKFFESMGMSFGQHQNAFTSFDQTTFMMLLPDTKEVTIKKVLLYFGDVANGLLLRDEEIDRERGVILEEARTRKGARQRLMEEALPRIFPGSRLKDRVPIGTEEVVKTAPRAQFVDFYRSWYRPSNATFIVCGDIDPKTITPWISETFSAWKPVKNPRAGKGPEIQPQADGLRAAVFTDPELPDANLSLATIRPKRDQKTVGDFRRSLVESIGIRIVNRRLREMRQTGDALFQGATVSSSNHFNAARGIDISADGDAAKWSALFEQVLVEVKRARVHGFLASEMADARKAILSGAERAVRAAATRNTNGLIMRLNSSVTSGRKPMSPTQRLSMLVGLIHKIDRSEVHKAFADGFRLDRGLVTAALPEKEGFTAPTKEELIAVVNKAAKADVTARGETKRAKSLLDKDPEPGAITTRTDDKDLAIATVTRANGVRCHARSMDFRKDSVQVIVHFVGGAFDETEKTAGLTGMAAIALRQGSAASTTHSSVDLSNLLTGKTIRYSAGAQDGGLTFRITASPKDFEDGFRLLHLLLTRPRLEQAAVDRWKQRMSQGIDARKSSVGAQASLAMQSFLTGGDLRLAPLTSDRLAALTTAGAQAWLQKILATAPIEVAIVGDFDQAKMIELARTYLGSLQKRAVSRDLTALRKVNGGRGPFVKEVAVKTITPQAILLAGWRGPAFANREDRRTLLFASLVGQARLTTAIREERGLAYSPSCRAVPAQGFETGNLMIAFPCDPAKAAEAATVAKQTLLDLVGDKPPTEAEIQSVRKQLVNILGTQMKQPAFWANILSTLFTNGRELEDIKGLLERYTNITAEQAVAVLKRYLLEDRYFQVVARPGG